MAEFKVHLDWQGSTVTNGYSRNAVARADTKEEVPLSSGVAYGGDGTRWNPEELLGASLANCHFLTFLALAHKFKIDVHEYHDNVTVTLENADKKTRVTKIRLAPDIVIAKGHDAAKTREAFEKSHQYCFIGNSITAQVVMEPTIREQT